MKFKEFFETSSETAKYKQKVVYPALGLAAETGEVVGNIQKQVRHMEKNADFDIGKRLEDIELELGDVMWYWSNLVKDLGLDPEVIFQKNYDKLRARYNK